MDTTDYSSRNLQLQFLTHREFKNSVYWRQVRTLVDAAYKRDQFPGESLAGYRKAFMRGIAPGDTKRKHMLLIHAPTHTMLTHHNAISTHNPHPGTEARLGHLVILPNITIDGIKLSNYHIDHVLIPFLRKKGFKWGRGSHYSIAGAIIGEKKGFRGYAITRRGKKYLKSVLTKKSAGIITAMGESKSGPELLMYYKLQLG